MPVFSNAFFRNHKFDLTTFGTINLLRDTNLTPGIAMDICRAFEMIHRQVKEMNLDSMIEKVNVSKTKQEYRKQNPRYESNADHENKSMFGFGSTASTKYTKRDVT